MSYEVRINSDGTWDLLDSDSTVIDGNNQLPVTTPDDIIDALLEDMGVGKPQRETFRVLFKRDWEVDDQR